MAKYKRWEKKRKGAEKHASKRRRKRNQGSIVNKSHSRSNEKKEGDDGKETSSMALEEDEEVWPRLKRSPTGVDLHDDEERQDDRIA